jgi:urease accessory protein UreH
VLAGDRFDVRGRVLERAALIATGQMATPVFPGITPAQAHATWTVAAGAVLCALTEPLLLEAGSRYAGRIDVDLEPGGIAILAETTAFRGPAQLSSRLTARIAGTPVLRDALERSGDAGDAAVGTIAIVSDESAFRAAVAEELRAYAANANRARIGWGETTAALMVRLTGTVWNVHACVREIAAAARRLSAAPQS